MAKAQTTTKAKATTKPASNTRAVKKPARKPVAKKEEPSSFQWLVGNKAQGRPRQIKHAEDLWKLFLDYKLYCKQNPKLICTASLGKLVQVPHEKPLTLEGFETYCHTLGISICNYMEQRNGDAYADFYEVVTYIRMQIRGEQIEGAMIGQYNGNIVARVNQLAERSENINTNVEVPLFPDVQEDNSNQ
jgi:hypothetical protein